MTARRLALTSSHLWAKASNEPKISGCRCQRARPCSPQPSSALSKLKSRHGLKGNAAARAAVAGGEAKAAILSYSTHCLATCGWRVRDFICCPCREGNGAATRSPLAELLPHHVAPERLYLETRWASLVPYAATAELLADVLPITTGANATTVRQHVLRVAERAEAELPKDLCTFMDGNPADWEALPIPDARIVVGLDGGYVRDWTERKSNFEVIVGRSMPEDGSPRYLGFVHGFDRKPKRRLVDTLKSQGMQANQDITFLTDGGEEVRALTERISPYSEHVLDWFHITMRITVLNQFAKGVAQYDEKAGAN